MKFQCCICQDEFPMTEKGMDDPFGVICKGCLAEVTMEATPAQIAMAEPEPEPEMVYRDPAAEMPAPELEDEMDEDAPPDYDETEPLPSEMRDDPSVEDESLFVEYDESLNDDSDDFRDNDLAMSAEW